MDTLDKIITWFGGLAKDYRDIERLLYAQKQLAVELYNDAKRVGELYELARGTEYARKTAFERERLRLIAEGSTAAKAEAEARTAVETLAFSETTADAEYRTALLRHQAAADILRAMQQHISSLKDERRFDMAGGSNE